MRITTEENMNYYKIALEVCTGKEKTIVFAYHNANYDRLKEKIKEGYDYKRNMSYNEILLNNIGKVQLNDDIFKFYSSLVD